MGATSLVRWPAALALMTDDQVQTSPSLQGKRGRQRRGCDGAVHDARGTVPLQLCTTSQELTPGTRRHITGSGGPTHSQEPQAAWSFTGLSAGVPRQITAAHGRQRGSAPREARAKQRPAAGPEARLCCIQAALSAALPPLQPATARMSPSPERLQAGPSPLPSPQTGTPCAGTMWCGTVG